MKHDHLPTESISTLDCVVMFPASQTTFQLVGNKPEWLSLLGQCTDNWQLILHRPEEFLENFLITAKQFWSHQSKDSLRSGKWQQTDDQGIDYAFEAIASLQDGQPVLLIQLITESYLEIDEILQSSQENALSRETIERLIYIDDVTELYNHLGFLLHAEKQLLVARYEHQAATVVCINLEQLKSINDQYGRSAGNRLLARTASLFKKAFREKDLLARIGGDKFVALIINIDSTKIMSFKKRLDQAIINWNAQNQPYLQISISIGLASDTSEQQLEELMNEASENMYSNKQRNYLTRNS